MPYLAMFYIFSKMYRFGRRNRWFPKFVLVTIFARSC